MSVSEREEKRKKLLEIIEALEADYKKCESEYAKKALTRELAKYKDELVRT